MNRFNQRKQTINISKREAINNLVALSISVILPVSLLSVEFTSLSSLSLGVGVIGMLGVGVIVLLGTKAVYDVFCTLGRESAEV